MTATKLTADVLFQMAKTRRTIYKLNKDANISASRIRELVEKATLHTPSSFNAQSNRAVVLLGAEHDKLWELTTNTLKAIVPEEKWQSTADRMAMFKGAAGTIMFFNDENVVHDMQAKFPSYADRFPIWANQSNAMQQWMLWTALELEGLGANLQHYNPLIDEEVAKIWDLPAGWKLNAQLVFGGKSAEAGEKQFKPLDDRVKFFGA
ncbi:nitroreductase family protein [Drechmeria coniospora]|uniref:Nitroreductase family protein n=1 Tax=Drechmeria coniospora TaxID=98403 RepID=A0A151GRN9_DRECN|nr:nitroreductase family protein [Drechmeria coniospora]KYK59728.1 nitroreductase family protein [Drechmeria coniospora]ODA78534.1 hypothetical protein RJ55_05915 [Drechmeria coniospora]